MVNIQQPHANEHGVRSEDRSIVMTIERVKSVIDEDTQFLRSGNLVDVAKFSERKNRCLIELNRVLSKVPRDHGAHERLAIYLEPLRTTLAENSDLLSARLNAIREVADLIAQAIKDAHSDGTYDAPTKAATV
ncbi:MAG: hypothetical protein AAGB04_05100 [Pseudomonadota bacterium]